jgi:hypothetical protein
MSTFTGRDIAHSVANVCLGYVPRIERNEWDVCKAIVDWLLDRGLPASAIFGEVDFKLSAAGSDRRSDLRPSTSAPGLDGAFMLPARGYVV